MVEQVHAAGIAHGQIDDRHLVAAGERLGIIDFRGGTVAASEARLRTDDAQALVTTALADGIPDALDAATIAIGSDRLAALLPYVQPSALTPRQRALLKAEDLDLDALREQAAERIGIEAIELQKMRRVSWGSLLQVGILVVAFFALTTAFGDVDWDVLVDQIGDANVWLVGLGLIVAQTPRFPQAISTLGASPEPVPLGQLYALQLATSYIGLAIPTSAARVAVNIRFFQRHGLPPGTAVAIGALDGFCGFLVQVLILTSILLLSPFSLGIDLSTAAPSGISLLVLILVGLGLVAIAIVLIVRRWREWVFGWVRRLVRQGGTVIRGLNSPRRILMLLGGNLMSEVLFATALGLFARSLGYDLGIVELLLINVERGAAHRVHPGARRDRRVRGRADLRARRGPDSPRRQRSRPHSCTGCRPSTCRRSGASSPSPGSSATSTSDDSVAPATTRHHGDMDAASLTGDETSEHKTAMLAGERYLASDPLLTAERTRAQLLMERYNASSIAEPGERRRLLADLLGGVGEGTEVRPPLYLDYGYPVTIGRRCFVNYGATMLDCAPIEIGDDVQIATGVQLLTATHPVDAAERIAGWESAHRITIGSGAWLGAGVIVCPGVTIGAAHGRRRRLGRRPGPARRRGRRRQPGSGARALIERGRSVLVVDGVGAVGGVAPVPGERHRLAGEAALAADVLAHRGHGPALAAAPDVEVAVRPRQGTDGVLDEAWWYRPLRRRGGARSPTGRGARAAPGGSPRRRPRPRRRS